MIFRNEYAFLSNFAPARVRLDEQEYLSVEAAFQAAKTLDPQERQMLGRLPPAEARRLGRRVKLRRDWEQVKLGIMLDLLRQKFAEPGMKQKLLATGSLELVEDNTWGDRYWGRCNGVGQNMLGKLLMQVRSELEK